MNTTQQQLIEKLLPCPFCGNKPSLAGKTSAGQGVVCCVARCSIEEWNTRSTPETRSNGIYKIQGETSDEPPIIDGVRPVLAETRADNIGDEVVEWRGPTCFEIITPEFNAIWDVIKTWDVNVPEQYHGYCGANGNHVMAILQAIKPYLRNRPEPEVSEEVVEVLKEAQETIDTLHREGNWDNGVYDPTGAISEGIVQTSKYVYSTLGKIDKVLEAYRKATGAV